MREIVLIVCALYLSIRILGGCADTMGLRDGIKVQGQDILTPLPQ